MSLIKKLRKTIFERSGDIISAGVYFGLIAPLSQIQKLTGKRDELELEFDKSKKSYWHKRDNVSEKRDYRNMY